MTANLHQPQSAYRAVLGRLISELDPDKEEEKAQSLVHLAEDDPVKWIQEHFFIPENRGPIDLAPHQQAVLREAYARDEDGKFKYSIVVWSDIKKSAKSTIAAAVALHRAVRLKWGSIKIVANDLKQADSRVAYYLRRAIQMNPEFQNVRQVRYLTSFPNMTTIEAIPIDPSGEAGGTDDLIIFSELWAAKHTAIKQMWAEMTLSPTKYGYSQRWIETYAGYSGESPILENLWRQGVEEGERLDLSFGDHDLSDLEVYANGPLLCYWNTVRGRLPWQTPEYYVSEAIAQTPNDMDRLHSNQWVSSTETFVPPEWWEACRIERLPEPNAYEPLVVALDAAVSGDCFGIVAVSARTEERKRPAGEDEVADSDGLVTYDATIVQARYARKWEPPKNGKIIYSDPNDPENRDTPEGELRWLIDRYNVVVVCYDEYQLHDFCTRLRDEGLAYFRTFAQGKDRLIADKQLRDSIRERTIEHDGHDALTSHIKNANAKTDNERLRIIKRSDHLKIDLAVCLSMANSVARKFNLA